MSTFSNNLKSLRESKGLTQDKLAQELSKVSGNKISRSRIGMYETGDRHPDQEHMALIADYFDVSMDSLFGRENYGAGELDQAYLRVMKDAQAKGYEPEDIELAMEFFDRARKRNKK